MSAVNISSVTLNIIYVTHMGHIRVCQARTGCRRLGMYLEVCKFEKKYLRLEFFC